MADTERFEHIRIGSASSAEAHEDEQDEVIVVGCVPEAPDVKGERSSVPDREDDEPLEPYEARTLGTSHGQGLSEDPGTGDREASDAQAVDEARDRKDEGDGYRATTLDDIDSSRMPRMQVAIIAVALACLAAFIIWYIAF